MLSRPDPQLHVTGVRRVLRADSERARRSAPARLRAERARRRANETSRLPNAQERLERTPLGQGLISGLIVTAVLTGIVWNLPDSPIRQRAMTVILPIGSA